MRPFLDKELVQKWIASKLKEQYSFTIYPRYGDFPEKFIRMLTDEGWQINNTEDKIIVIAADPVKTAALMLKVQRMGYFTSE